MNCCFSCIYGIFILFFFVLLDIINEVRERRNVMYFLTLFFFNFFYVFEKSFFPQFFIAQCFKKSLLFNQMLFFRKICQCRLSRTINNGTHFMIKRLNKKLS